MKAVFFYIFETLCILILCHFFMKKASDFIKICPKMTAEIKNQLGGLIVSGILSGMVSEGVERSLFSSVSGVGSGIYCGGSLLR